MKCGIRHLRDENAASARTRNRASPARRNLARYRRHQAEAIIVIRVNNKGRAAQRRASCGMGEELKA